MRAGANGTGPFCFSGYFSIFVEALAGLAAQQAGTHHLAQQGVRTVLRVAELLVEHLHDGEVDVVADEVGQRQGAHRVVGAEHHALVDVLGRGNAVGQDAHGLVDHGDEDAVHHKAGGFLHLDGLLADLGGQVDSRAGGEDGISGRRIPCREPP